MENNDYLYVNIRTYLDNLDKNTEQELEKILQGYSCPKNPDVEHFLRNNAIDFAKRNQSVTYLVFSTVDGTFLGYFTIAIKAITIKIEQISNTVSKKLARISDFDEETRSYTIPAFLVAQLGKNYTENADKLIEGSELLNMAWSVIKEIQYAAGGIIVFLETENHNELLNFYSVKNNFKRFDTRESNSTGKELIQLLKLL